MSDCGTDVGANGQLPSCRLAHAQISAGSAGGPSRIQCQVSQRRQIRRSPNHLLAPGPLAPIYLACSPKRSEPGDGNLLARPARPHSRSDDATARATRSRRFWVRHMTIDDLDWSAKTSIALENTVDEGLFALREGLMLGNLTRGLLCTPPEPSARLRVPATVLLFAWRSY
jgi:hypothetical protein